MSPEHNPHPETLRYIRPLTRADLHWYLRRFLNLTVPDRPLCPGHSAPMDYLWHAYHTDFAAPPPANGDCVVWANRGGGKTQLAAVATLLEALFKPRCQTRFLAGSRDQARRMYDYLAAFLTDDFKSLLHGRLLADACRFANGASVRVLAQSAPAIRGRHIHKLRCDEVELFNPDLFAAAQFVTRSADALRGAMEIFSTFHRPYGLMQQVLDRAEDIAMPVFKWCLWEVIEPCTTDRSCSRCPLADDCRGIARSADGYLTIDDCITRMKRSSRAGFEAEMLCLRPMTDNAVFADFDPAHHVAPAPFRPDLPLYRTLDFGFVNPFVCLWVQADGDRFFIIDEYVQRRKTIAEHAAQIKRRTPCPESRVAATYCDPTGVSPSDITGTGSVRELADKGIHVVYRRSRIHEGVEMIRAALLAGDGTRRLTIDPRCAHTIEALRCYRYTDTTPKAAPSEIPHKDGIHDHPIDALRYFFVNHRFAAPPRCRNY